MALLTCCIHWRWASRNAAFVAIYIALTSREASGTTFVNEFNDVDENEEVGFRSDSRLPGNCSGSNSAD